MRFSRHSPPAGPELFHAPHRFRKPRLLQPAFSKWKGRNSQLASGNFLLLYSETPQLYHLPILHCSSSNWLVHSYLQRSRAQALFSHGCRYLRLDEALLSGKRKLTSASYSGLISPNMRIDDCVKESSLCRRAKQTKHRPCSIHK